MSMLFGCCCTRTVPLGQVPILTDVLGGTRFGANYLGWALDWGVEVQSQEFTLTYTSEPDLTTHRNPLGWGWYAGYFGTYRTLSPESVLSPQTITGLRLLPNLYRMSYSTSFVPSMSLINPVRYQVFLDDVAISAVIDVPVGVSWNGALDCTLPTHNRSHPYRQYRLKVVCDFEIPDPPAGFSFHTCLVPYGGVWGDPGLRASYLLGRAPTGQNGIKVLIAETGFNSFAYTSPAYDTLGTQGLRQVPVGNAAMPLQSPWYQRPGAIDSALPDVMSPTFGYWDISDEPREFFIAATPAAGIQAPLVPGPGTIRTVTRVDP